MTTSQKKSEESTEEERSDDETADGDDSEENTPAKTNTDEPTESLAHQHPTTHHNRGNYGCYGSEMAGKYIAQNRNKYGQT